MFDIDHLYLASYNYNLVTDQTNGESTATTTFHPTDKDGKFNSKYHQNRILDVLLTLLKDTDNSINSLYKSIDNDTELVTKVSDQVPEEGSTKALPYNFGTLHEQVTRKNDYITGKTGIGPFALNVTNQELTRLFHVSFKDTNFARATEIQSLDHITDRNDDYISSWLSAFINAHVDIVKDPYISKLNVNQYTYNMLNLLIRSGWGDLALWFIAQPIIRDMSAASDRAKSQYTRDTERAKSLWAAEEIAVKEALSNYLTEAEMSPSVIDRYTRSTSPADMKVRINTIAWVSRNADVLAEIVKNPGASTVTVDGKQYNVKSMQKTIFYVWKTLESRAIALSNMVQHTKIDTRKHGKDLISINVYKDGYDKLFHPIDESKSLWDMDTLRTLERYSWIGVKTDLAIAMPSLILGEQTFNANPEFIEAVFSFGNQLSTTGGVLNKDTLKLIARSLITAVKSEYFVKYVQENLCKPGQDASEYIRSLMIGPNSMNSRLTRLKNQIETNPVYARLANNHLINQIYSEIEEDDAFAFGRRVTKPAFVTILNNVDNSRVNSELLMDGWDDLLRDDDQFVRKFANDLIIYAFFTSGEFKGWNKMLKYVPTTWLTGQYNIGKQSYVEFIEEALKRKASDYAKYMEDIIANNAMDSKLVRKMPIKNSDDTSNFVDYNTIIMIGKETDINTDAEQYILVRRGNGYNISDYYLYKLVDYVGPGTDWHQPVYARIKKKGYHTQGYDIYEYGWDLNYGENENDAMLKFDVNEAITRVEEIAMNDGDILSMDSELQVSAIKDVYLGNIDGFKKQDQKSEDNPATKESSTTNEHEQC